MSNPTCTRCGKPTQHPQATLCDACIVDALIGPGDS